MVLATSRAHRIYDPTQGMPKNVGEVGSKLFTRVEYETISKLETNGFSLFTVKTYLEPLENFRRRKRLSRCSSPSQKRVKAN